MSRPMTSTTSNAVAVGNTYTSAGSESVSTNTSQNSSSNRNQRAGSSSAGSNTTPATTTTNGSFQSITKLQLNSLPLFGRQKEIDILNSSFERIRANDNNNKSNNINSNMTTKTDDHDDDDATKKQNLQQQHQQQQQMMSEIVLIHGQSGVGKSALIDNVIKVQERIYNSSNMNNDDTSLGETYTSSGNNNNNNNNNRNSNDNAISSSRITFCSGKFNQTRSQEPYLALQQAFTELCDTLNYDNYDVDSTTTTSNTTSTSTSTRQAICQDLQTTLGNEATILVDVIPGILTLIDPPVVATTTSNTGDDNDEGDLPQSKYTTTTTTTTRSNYTQDNKGSFNRLKYLFRLFVGTICKHLCLVLFIDDIQWSDDSTLQLLEAILSDSSINRNFVFIGSYRDDDDDDDDDTKLSMNEDEDIDSLLSLGNNIKNKSTTAATTTMLQTFQELEKLRPITKIQLGPLNHDAILELLVHITKLESDEVMLLANVVERKTHGNVFVMLEFLQHIESEQYLWYSLETYKWTYDLNLIESETFLASDSIVDVVSKRISRLNNDQVVSVLKIAACLWAKFELSSLQEILKELPKSYGVSTMANDTTALQSMLDIAVQEGLLDKLSSSNVGGRFTYQFSHDRIQQSAYSLIPEGRERDICHLRLGNILLKIYTSKKMKKKKKASKQTAAQVRIFS